MGLCDRVRPWVSVRMWMHVCGLPVHVCMCKQVSV